MPTVIMLLGWRLFFYANEGYEPVHIHCRKGDMECKFWLLEDSFDIEEAYSRGLSPRERRQVRRIIFDHFDLIVDHWEQWHGDSKQ